MGDDEESLAAFDDRDDAHKAWVRGGRRRKRSVQVQDDVVIESSTMYGSEYVGVSKPRPDRPDGKTPTPLFRVEGE